MQQCSLRIERRGDVLLVVFSFQKEGEKGSKLFALCKIDLVGTGNSMDHFVQPVGDSSRYFAVRVTDETGGREAVVGLGFREREEAADFSQCLINYYNAIAKERFGQSQQWIGYRYLDYIVVDSSTIVSWLLVEKGRATSSSY